MRPRPWGPGLIAVLAISACAKSGPRAPLTISVPYQIDTLDPHARDRLGNAAIASHFYDALVTLDREMVVQPRLAERWATADPLTWVLHLRSGVRFHDGRPLTAADVVYTLDRLRHDPSLECGLYTAQITSVRALDERAVELKTERPMAFLLNKLATVFVVAAGSGASLATHENGTGPYRLAEMAPGRIRMTASREHWGPRPEVEDVTFLLGRSAADAAEDVSRRRSQLAQCSSRQAVLLLEGRPDVKIVKRGELFVKVLGFDVVSERARYASARRNPFRSRAVREAVSLAIDRRALAEGFSTYAVPAGQLVPPAVFGYDPSLEAPPHDPARAARLLAEAGFPGGFDATLHTRKRFGDAARRVAALLAPVGIRVSVEELPDDRYYEMASRHELSFFLMSFGCASGDISDLLDAVVHSVDTARRFGTSNFEGFSSPALDDAIERSAQIPNPTDRRAALSSLVGRVMAEHLLVPLYVDENVCAVARPFVFQPRANSYVLAAEVSRLGP